LETFPLHQLLGQCYSKRPTNFNLVRKLSYLANKFQRWNHLEEEGEFKQLSIAERTKLSNLIA
jgi:hypothetical protein